MNSKMLIVLIVLVVSGVVAVCGCTSDNSKDSGSVLNVSDVKVVPDGYGDYKCTCTIVPSKDLDYVEMVGIWYDASGAVVHKSSLMWNMNNLKAGQAVKAKGNGLLYDTGKPVKVQILIFDHAFHDGDESNAVFKQEIKL